MVTLLSSQRFVPGTLKSDLADVVLGVDASKPSQVVSALTAGVKDWERKDYNITISELNKPSKLSSRISYAVLVRTLRTGNGMPEFMTAMAFGADSDGKWYFQGSVVGADKLSQTILYSSK
jgi:hypothetical protein